MSHRQAQTMHKMPRGGGPARHAIISFLSPTKPPPLHQPLDTSSTVHHLALPQTSGDLHVCIASNLPVCIIFFPAALLVAKYVLAPLQHFILIHLSSRAGNVQHWHGGHGPPPTAVCTLRPRQYLIYLGLTKNTRRRQLRYKRTRRSCRLARRRHLGCANASRLLCGLQEVCSKDIRCA